MATIRIGISGWNYDNWRGDFYPRDLPRRRHLEYAARVFRTLEINGTFYSLKKPATFDAWRDAAPAGFIYAVKGSRYLTHTRRLRDAETGLANFFASGVLKLGDALGPFLWQLPPNMPFEPDALRRFCDLLPKDAQAAAALARKHDDIVKGRAWFDVEANHNLRHAFEVRDERWMTDELISILHDAGHALVFADSAGEYPYVEDITAGFIYIRLHGSTELYASGYTDDELSWWVRRIRRWTDGGQMKTGPRLSDRSPPRRKSRDVYVYFDNDANGHAPFDAINLARKLDAANDLHTLQTADGDPMPPPPRLAEANAGG